MRTEDLMHTDGSDLQMIVDWCIRELRMGNEVTYSQDSNIVKITFDMSYSRYRYTQTSPTGISTAIYTYPEVREKLEIDLSQTSNVESICK